MNPETMILINNYKEIIGIIAVMVVSLTMWLRKERIANAKTDAEVSAQKSESKKHEGQNAEIDILLLRMTAGETERAKQAQEIKKQGEDILDLKEEISQLEMILVGISIMFNNILLCEDCRKNNVGTVNAIKDLLDQIKIRKNANKLSKPP